ncbi:MAG: hypothetical protein ABIU87_01415 [Ornithinibacter sp.]
MRVEDPADADASVAGVLAHDGPALLDAATHPHEIALSPRPTMAQEWGFGIAKIKETLVSRE